ncbi:MAG TPA: fumarylacetoacetate hydrolase family protein [Kofleriaceae bacterium]|nr:fumarylacetoacetate hydrolase family protein [Kofleriaceae bacterium]
MPRELDRDRPQWKGQRPWFEVWFAVVIDAGRRRALWIRQTMFVPRDGNGRATIWGAWFDADASPPRRAAKRYVPIERARVTENDAGGAGRLIEIEESWLGRDGAAGSVAGLAWTLAWSGGRIVPEDVPTWVPAPTHFRPLLHDADATGTITLGDDRHELRGRAIAMHLWGRRRVPTLHWIYAPWIGDGSLEVQAISMRDRLAMGLATLRLDPADPAAPADPLAPAAPAAPATPAADARAGERGLHKPPAPLTGRPATAAHPSCLITATVAGARRLIHARAWAEPEAMVGYVYRDTDDRDLMVAQSDIGSAQLETYARTAPGAPWRPVDERRAGGGVAVEIQQRTPLPGVDYLAWDATERPAHLPGPPAAVPARLPERVDWPDVTAIVALGLTYGDHVRETGQKVDPSAPPTSFEKHVRAFAPGAATVRVPGTAALTEALDAVEPGLGAQLLARMPLVPAVMDYEGELALVALGAIDEASLARGAPQPFGLAAANDLTARVCQVLGETTAHPLHYWSCAKSFPGFLPLAPLVWAPTSGLSQIPELTIETRVNGELRQQASTKILIYPLPAIVRAAAAQLGRPLTRGDVILTGTPAGVGLRMSPIKRRVAALIKDRFRKAELLVSSFATSTELLRPGDVIEVDIGPAGRIRTRLGV